MSKFYVTTPIYYVNAEPHIGHTYTTVAADVLARYHRMIGDTTFFLTGTDEHGEKIEQKAQEEKMENQTFVDKVAALYETNWDQLNISNDNFLRTTDPKHKETVQKVLQYLFDKEYLYKGKHEGLYCVGCEQYKTERDLVEGKCPDHQKEPEVISEDCYMFKLSAFADELQKRIESDELKIRPESKKKEILSFYKQGLHDISFSRTKTKWGVPFPWDEDHVSYVWPDAFLNYLTGINWDGSPGSAPEQWPPDLQLMSKDIVRVHATIWPAMLLALDLPLPKQLFVHGFFLVDGQKMSKSIGNVIAPKDLVEKYGVDATRYLLMSATTFGHDGDIGWEKFDTKYNAELADNLGNLASRVLAMTEKYLDGAVPAKAEGFLGDSWNDYQTAMNEVRIHDALDATWNLVRRANQYVEEQKPWELAKQDDKKPLEDTLYVLLESLEQIAKMITPFMPETAAKLSEQLGKELALGGKIEKGEALFPKIE